MNMTLQFDPNNPDDVRKAIQTLNRLPSSDGVPDTTAAPDMTAAPHTTAAPASTALAAPTPTPQHDVVKFHRQTSKNESRRFLETLTTDRLTFKELAARMPKRGGTHHSPDSMRAIFRNVKRKEKSLIASGVLQGAVVKTDFSDYDADGGGRYYLTADAVDALNEYLGR